MSKLSPEEEAREWLLKNRLSKLKGDEGYTTTISTVAAHMAAYASHVSAPLKAKLAAYEILLTELEAQLAQQHKDFVECNDILRKEFDAAEARVKAYEILLTSTGWGAAYGEVCEDHPEIADQVKQFADRSRRGNEAIRRKTERDTGTL